MKEILVRAVNKAREKGYKLPIEDYELEVAELYDGFHLYYGREYSIRDIIFSHEFAKAFWGEKYLGISIHLGNNYSDGIDEKTAEEWFGKGILDKLKTHKNEFKPYTSLQNSPNGSCAYYLRADYHMHWERHLKKMVLEEEPLKYLEIFL